MSKLVQVFFLRKRTQRFKIYVTSSVLALKCQECADIPGHPSFSSCTSQDIKSIKCTTPGFDSCMTLKMTMEVPAVGPFNAEIRNCSSRSLFCDKGSDLNLCKLTNDSTGGMLTGCSTVCCEGDMCNKDSSRPWSLRGLLPGLN